MDENGDWAGFGFSIGLLVGMSYGWIFGFNLVGVVLIILLAALIAMRVVRLIKRYSA